MLDTLLIVQDDYKLADCFHIFRKSDGAFVRSFCKKGRGPGEALNVNSASVDRTQGTLTAFDQQQKKLLTFDIAKILKDETPYYQEIAVSQPPNVITRMLPRGDGQYVVKGLTAPMRWGVWNPATGQFSGIYTDFPHIGEDTETDWSLGEYAAVVHLSPDGKKLVAGTYIGAMLEVFNVADSGFIPTATRYFLAPVYRCLENATPKWAVPTDETIIGFDNIFVTDRAIFAIVWGVSDLEHNRPDIIVFAMDGTPRARYTTAESLECIAVDGRTLYGAGTNSEGNYTLNQYIIPE